MPPEPETPDALVEQAEQGGQFAAQPAEALSRSGELGQGLIEYAIIIFLVAIVVIAILLLLGPQIGAVFNQIYATI